MKNEFTPITLTAHELDLILKLRANDKNTGFKKELENLINRYSKENGSNTPDFILAEYMSNCLTNFNDIVTKREKWYGRETKISKVLLDPPTEI